MMSQDLNRLNRKEKPALFKSWADPIKRAYGKNSLRVNIERMEINSLLS